MEGFLDDFDPQLVNQDIELKMQGSPEHKGHIKHTPCRPDNPTKEIINQNLKSINDNQDILDPSEIKRFSGEKNTRNEDKRRSRTKTSIIKNSKQRNSPSPIYQRFRKNSKSDRTIKGNKDSKGLWDKGLQPFHNFEESNRNINSKIRSNKEIGIKNTIKEEADKNQPIDAKDIHIQEISLFANGNCSTIRNILYTLIKTENHTILGMEAIKNDLSLFNKQSYNLLSTQKKNQKNFTKKIFRLLFEVKLISCYKIFVEKISQENFVDMLEIKYQNQKENSFIINRFEIFVPVNLHILAGALIIYDKRRKEINDVHQLRGYCINSIKHDKDNDYPQKISLKNSKKSVVIYFKKFIVFEKFYKTIYNLILHKNFFETYNLTSIIQVNSLGNYYEAKPNDTSKNNNGESQSILVKLIPLKNCIECEDTFDTILGEINITESTRVLNPIVYVKKIWLSPTTLVFEYSISGENIIPLSHVCCSLNYQNMVYIMEQILLQFLILETLNIPINHFQKLTENNIFLKLNKQDDLQFSSPIKGVLNDNSNQGKEDNGDLNMNIRENIKVYLIIMPINKTTKNSQTTIEILGRQPMQYFHIYSNVPHYVGYNFSLACILYKLKTGFNLISGEYTQEIYENLRVFCIGGNKLSSAQRFLLMEGFRNLGEFIVEFIKGLLSTDWRWDSFVFLKKMAKEILITKKNKLERVMLTPNQMKRRGALTTQLDVHKFKISNPVKIDMNEDDFGANDDEKLSQMMSDSESDTENSDSNIIPTSESSELSDVKSDNLDEFTKNTTNILIPKVAAYFDNDAIFKKEISESEMDSQKGIRKTCTLNSNDNKVSNAKTRPKSNINIQIQLVKESGSIQLINDDESNKSILEINDSKISNKYVDYLMNKKGELLSLTDQFIQTNPHISDEVKEDILSKDHAFSGAHIVRKSIDSTSSKRDSFNNTIGFNQPLGGFDSGFSIPRVKNSIFHKKHINKHKIINNHRLPPEINCDRLVFEDLSSGNSDTEDRFTIGFQSRKMSTNNAMSKFNSFGGNVSSYSNRRSSEDAPINTIGFSKGSEKINNGDRQKFQSEMEFESKHIVESEILSFNLSNDKKYNVMSNDESSGKSKNDLDMKEFVAKKRKELNEKGANKKYLKNNTNIFQKIRKSTESSMIGSNRVFSLKFVGHLKKQN